MDGRNDKKQIKIYGPKVQFSYKDQDLDLLGSFDEGEDPSTGHSLHWLRKLPSSLSEEYTGERKIDPYYEDSYIFTDKNQTFFHVRNGRAEKLKFNDFEGFKNAFFGIMQEEDKRFSLNWIPKGEFDKSFKKFISFSNELDESPISSVIFEQTKPTEPVSYPPELAPSQELIEASKQKIKDFFCDKEGSYGVTHFNKNEDPLTGHRLHWVRKLPFYISDKYTGEREIDPYYEDSYVFVEKIQSFFKVKNAHAEKIELGDLEGFKKVLLEIMNQVYKYDFKWITQEQLNNLLNFTTNHLTLSKQEERNDINLKSTDLNAEKTATTKLPKTLMQDLFPRVNTKKSNPIQPHSYHKRSFSV